jgi:hypothetical protein
MTQSIQEAPYSEEYICFRDNDVLKAGVEYVLVGNKKSILDRD